MRDIITMACGDCKRELLTTKNKKTTPDRLELKKYCKFCRKHTPHKEHEHGREPCKTRAFNGYASRPYHGLY